MSTRSKISKYLAEIGAKGGKKRAANLSVADRSEIAKKAAAARWAKVPEAPSAEIAEQPKAKTEGVPKAKSK